MADIRQSADNEPIGPTGGSLGGTFYGTQFVRNASGSGEVLQPEWKRSTRQPGIGFEVDGRCVWCNCPTSAHHQNCRFK